MRSQWCREHIEETAKQCGLGDNVVSEVKKVAKFCASNPAFADCGTRAIYRLISISDEDVRNHAISLAEKALNEETPTGGKKRDRLTEREIKKIIDRSFKEVRTDLTEKYKSEKPNPPNDRHLSSPVSGLATVPKGHPNHGVGCAQPGSDLFHAP